MLIVVGSTNPVKIAAAQLGSAGLWPEVRIVGTAVASGVGSQPASDAQTRRGAHNRALRALENNQEYEALGLGLEGGVWELNGELWSVVWACVVDRSGYSSEVSGARLKVPKAIASLILQGMEMGEAVERLTKIKDVKKAQGMFGVITRGILDRKAEYSHLARTAFALYLGRDWQKDYL